MGRLLSEKGGVASPLFAGPAEEDIVPDRLKINGRIPTWKQATRCFRTFVESLEEEDVIAHRALDFETYTSTWASAAWSDLYQFDQEACQWAESTVLINFSGSYWIGDDANTFIPPVTYLETLQSSRQARQKALSRALRDVSKWASIRAIGGSGHNGYPRVFVGLYLSESVTKGIFEPVLRSHVNNCPIAESDSHSIESIVTLRNSPDQKSQLIHGIGKRIPGLESQDGITSESWEKQKIATLLHGSQSRPYSFGLSI